MTDHAALADAIVAAAFGPADHGISGIDGGHVGVCPSCSVVLAGVRADASAVATYAAGDPAAWVRQRVLRAAGGRRSAWSGVARLFAIGLLAVAAVAGGVAGGGALLGLRTAAEGPPPPILADLVSGKPVIWKTSAVLLAADEVTVEANGATLHPARNPSKVGGDPGSLTYATLEIAWAEAGREQRINLYLAADATSWWMSEARAYDNVAVGAKPDWAMLGNLVGRQPLGQPFAGDLDLAGSGRAGPVHVRIAGAVLAMSPQRSYVDPAVGGGPLDGDPFAIGGPLRCSGILQLSPPDAERELAARGIRLSWRFTWKTGPDMGFAELRLHAPATGWISSTALGGDGELIVFVEDPARPMGDPIPFPKDCPAQSPA